MDFFEAMALIQVGYKVRLKSWEKGQYIGVKEEEIKVFGKKKTKYTVVNADESEISPLVSFSALLKSEWERSTED